MPRTSLSVMRIVIAGGHGKIALRLARLLAQRGDTPVGLIRNPDHADDVRAAGAEPVVIDLEATTVTQVAEKMMGADAVVFAAGAGPGSGAARKDTVDRAAAILTADAASLVGARRFLMISAMGVDEGPAPDADRCGQPTCGRRKPPTTICAGEASSWTGRFCVRGG